MVMIGLFNHLGNGFDDKNIGVWRGVGGTDKWNAFGAIIMILGCLFFRQPENFMALIKSIQHTSRE